MTADTPANPPVEIALESEARIEGRIRDEQGKPVAGAIVCGRAAGKETLFFSSGRLDPGMRFAVTDEEGRYALEHLSAGAWSVECRGPASHMMGYATNLSVQPGETLDGVDLAVEAEWMFRPSDG